jgi:parallel beta-helix repeat protein
MISFKKNLYGRISNIALAFLLTISSLSAVVPIFLSQTANAATLEVSADGSGTYATIQDAVNAASTGDIITVGAGTYTGQSVVISTPGITIDGAEANVSPQNRTHDSSDESVIPGASTYAASFDVEASNVTINGFDFGPSSDGISAGPIGVDLGSSNGATVENSIFEHNQRGISLDGATNATIENNTISDNNADPQNNAGVWGDGVDGINISDNDFDGASNTAINISTSSNITINANVFTNNGSAAVIWQDSNATFSNNYARGFDGSGVYVTGSDGVTIKANDITSGPGHNGISLSDAAGASSNVSITNNTINGFDNGINIGASDALSDVLTATGNDLSGNSVSGINAPSASSAIVNAANNWWGDASGPNDTISNDGSTLPTNNGSGSPVFGAVNYEPWCVSSTCGLSSNTLLPAPTNLTPTNGTTTNDTNFDDTWTPVTGALKYEYQVSLTTDGTNLTGPISQDDSTGSNYDVTSTLITRHNTSAPSQTYYWQVSTVNAEGVHGPWSPVTEVTVNTSAPAQPTGLKFQFQYDPISLTDPTYINFTAKPNGNNLELLWDAPKASDWVTGYHILASFPDGTTSLGYQGPNTNAWLMYNGFGQHGDGAYTYQVVAVNPNGDSVASTSDTIYYDTTVPTATLTDAPANNSFVNSNFHVEATASDNVKLQNVFFDVRSQDGNTWESGCTTSPDLTYSNDQKDATISCDIDTSGLTSGTTYMLRVHASDEVGYGNVNPEAISYFTYQTSAPSQPTGLSARFQNDSQTIQSGSTLNKTNDGTNNNLELTWSAPASNEWVTGYHILVTTPSGSTLTYQGPNTNAWLAQFGNDFGQNGDGTYTYQVVAVNPNGESVASDIYTLYYDTTPPTATLTEAPANGSFIKATSFHVEATASDDVALSDAFFDVRSADGSTWESGCETGTSVITYTNDNKDATLSCTIDASNLVDGTSYIIRVHADDKAGYGNVNSGSQNTFTIDRTAPVVNISTPTTNQLVNGTIQLEGSAVDANPYSYNWTVKNAQGHIVSSHTYHASTVGNYALNTKTLKDGSYTVYLRATDAADNSSVTSVAITVDNTAPAVPTLTFPANNVYRQTSGNNYSAWTAVTDLHGPVTYNYESAFNTSFTQIAYGPSSLTTTTIKNPGEPEGTYYWRVQACDSLGNCSTWSPYETIHIDNTAPTTPGTPTAKTPSNSDTINWTWTPSIDTSGPAGSNSGLKGYDYTLTNGQTTIIGQTDTTNPSVATTVGKDGTYTLSVYAIDNVGNETPVVSGNVLVDTTAPSVTIDPVTTPTNNTTPIITGTYADNDSNNDTNLSLTINGSPVLGIKKNSDNTWTYTPSTPLPEGAYTLIATATDTAGNFSDTSKNPTVFTIDTTAPLLTVDESTGTSTTPTITGTTSDANDVVVVDGVTAVVSTTPNANGTYTWTVTLPTQPVGSNPITITTTDLAGNITSESAIVKVVQITTTPTPTQTVTVTPTPAANTGVLGASTTTPNTSNTTKPAVLGSSTVKSVKHGFVLAWYWWVLIILAVIALLWWIIMTVRRRSQEA